jgi:hypothetical protein
MPTAAAILKPKSYLVEGLNNPFEEANNTIILFDDNYTENEVHDIVYKYKNEGGRWAFKWVKKSTTLRTEFMSSYEYDDIISAKNNRVVFMKNGRKGFWYFNTRTEFFYP